MPSDPTYLYIEIADYRSDTNQSSLVGPDDATGPLTDTQVKSLILESMVMIDGFVGEGWEPFDEDQEFVFPRCIDTDSAGAVDLPRTLTIAARLLCDHILVNRTKGINPDDIQSESDLGYSYSKFDRKSKTNSTQLPDAVVELLERYRVAGGGGFFGIPSYCEYVYQRDCNN